MSRAIYYLIIDKQVNYLRTHLLTHHRTFYGRGGSTGTRLEVLYLQCNVPFPIKRQH